MSSSFWGWSLLSGSSRLKALTLAAALHYGKLQKYEREADEKLKAGKLKGRFLYLGLMKVTQGKKEQALLYCVWVWKWRDFLSKVSCIFRLSKEECLQVNMAHILPEDLDAILATEENWSNVSFAMHLLIPISYIFWLTFRLARFPTSVREFDHKKVITWCL